MDFGTWLRDGIPYVDSATEARLLQEASSEPERKTFQLQDATYKAFADVE